MVGASGYGPGSGQSVSHADWRPRWQVQYMAPTVTSRRPSVAAPAARRGRGTVAPPAITLSHSAKATPVSTATPMRAASPSRSGMRITS